MPALISFVGSSNSGKTTLITKLIPLFVKAGLKVGTVKNTHHKVQFDQPGKDSWKHKQAGSSQVLLLSEDSFSLLSDIKPDTTLNQLADKFFRDFDLVISEGFKNEDCFKIEVFRSANNKAPLFLDPKYNIQAVVSDQKLDCEITSFNLNNIKEIFEWICAQNNSLTIKPINFS